MMKPISQSRREAERFGSSFIPDSLEVKPIDRRFHAVADVEAILWLQLGSELGIFGEEDAETIWETFQDNFRRSYEYVTKLGTSRFFPNEVRNLLKQLENVSITKIRYPHQLGKDLINTRGLEMLFHEVGSHFRSASLTRYVAFDTFSEWGSHFETEPDPDLILAEGSLIGLNALLDAFLRFIDHMGAMGEFFRQLEHSAESNYSALEVKRRIRSIHNWRLDLRAQETRARFIHVTSTLLRSLADDYELSSLDFDISSLLVRIERLCANWTGDSEFVINIPLPGGGKKRATG